MPQKRYAWEKIELPYTVGEFREKLGIPDALKGVPDDAEICPGDLASSGATIEWRREWTAEEYEAEAERLRQIEIAEANDRKAGF